MDDRRIENADFSETGYSYTLSLIAGKYKPIILYCLMEYEPVRFNEMQRYLGRVADKTLSRNLKELERDELIVRTVYPQIPPKVEYSLTERGHSLVAVLDRLCDWGMEKACFSRFARALFESLQPQIKNRSPTDGGRSVFLGKGIAF